MRLLKFSGEQKTYKSIGIVILSVFFRDKGIIRSTVPRFKTMRYRQQMYVYLWLIHIVLWQKPKQHYKAILLQLKINFKKCMDKVKQCLPSLAWKIPWMEEPDRLQSTGSQRVRHDWATSLHFKDDIYSLDLLLSSFLLVIYVGAYSKYIFML